MSSLLVLVLIVAAIVIDYFAGGSPFYQKAARIGGFAFILYGLILGLIYLMGAVKGG